MKILIVAATWMEVKIMVDEWELVEEKSYNFKHFRFGDINPDILITGIGATFTTFHLTNTLRENKYQMVINIGIAGSFIREIKIGEVVSVVSEEFADLGIEKENEFLTLFESGFMQPDEFPFEHGILKATALTENSDLRKVKGITTNKSHGRTTSIAQLNGKFMAQIESMEGAAVFYVCNWFGVPVCQVRAISNYVEPRDSARWNIPLALENLKTTVLALLKKQMVPVN